MIGTRLCVERLIPNAVVEVPVRILDGLLVHRDGRQHSGGDDRLCRR